MSWALRMLYCLALIAPIIPAAVFLGWGWVEMNATATMWPTYRIAIVLLELARLVFVMIRPRALQAYVGVPLLRFLSIAAMIVGSILAVAAFFYKPITLGLFGASKSPGVGWGLMIVAAVLTYGALLGTLGVVVFELNRGIGEVKTAFARLADRRRSRGR